MNKAPSYPWYPRDFAGDEPVQLMTLEEEGAYRRLLDHQWMHGSIPADLKQIAKVCKNVPLAKMKKLWPSMACCFVPMEDQPERLYNRKLERVRQERRDYIEKQSEAGKRGATARWGDRQNGGDPNGDPMATPLADECLASANASSNKKHTNGRPTWLTPFSASWTAGTPPFGKMADALKPLVTDHGEPEVLEHWQRYLSSTDPRFWSPHRFASTYAAWNANQPIPGIADEPDIEWVD